MLQCFPFQFARKILRILELAKLLNFSQLTHFGHLLLKTREKSMTFKPLWQVFHHVSLLFVTEAALLQRQALIAAGGLNSATTSKTTTCDMLFSLIIAYLFLRTI